MRYMLHVQYVPVEMCDILSARPAFSTAATESLNEEKDGKRRDECEFKRGERKTNKILI